MWSPPDSDFSLRTAGGLVGREHGPVQDAEELAPVNGQLGPPVAGGEAPGLAPDPLPVPGVVHELRGGDADAVQILEKTELGQLAYGVGQDVDANAQLIHGRRGLVDLHVRCRRRAATGLAPSRRSLPRRWRPSWCSSCVDRGRLRAQLLEERPRGVEVLELEQLASDDLVALEQREQHGEKLERTTLRERAERVADTEGAVLCGGDFVQVLDDRVGRLLEQRGNPPDVAVSAIDPTGAGAPMVVEDEVVR